jgi:hypothetical protein
MASMWSQRLLERGIAVSAAISEGSRENIEALRISDADIIIADKPLCEMAGRGTGLFNGEPVKEIRAMAPLWNEALHLVIRSELAKTGTIKDLEGLTIATGLPESGARLLAELALSAPEKRTGKKTRLRFMSNRKAAHAFSRGRVDGLALVGAPPIPILRRLTLQDKVRIRFISFTEDQLEEMIRSSGAKLLILTIPPALYPGMRGPVRTIGAQKLLAVSSALESRVVYALTKTLYTGLDQLVKAHPAAREISPAHGIIGLNIPLHPGARRYFQERGLLAPAHTHPVEDETRESDRESAIAQ